MEIIVKLQIVLKGTSVVCEVRIVVSGVTTNET